MEGGGGDATGYDRAPFAAVVAAMLVLQGAAHIGLLAAGVHAGAGATAAPALHIVLAIVAAWVVVSADRAIASAHAALQAVIAGILELLTALSPAVTPLPMPVPVRRPSSGRSRAARRPLGSDRARAPFRHSRLGRSTDEEPSNMTSAMAVLLAVLSAAIGVLNRSTTAVPTPIGVGAAYTLAPGPPLSGAGDACTAGRSAVAAAHVELFAQGRALLIPVGVGVGRGCRHSLWTSEPTGVIHISGGGATLGRLFAIWGQPLAHNRLAGFTAAGPVRVYVDGVRVSGTPAVGRGCDHMPRSWSSWAATSRRIGSTSSRRAHETAVVARAGGDGCRRHARRLWRRGHIAGAAVDRSRRASTRSAGSAGGAGAPGQADHVAFTVIQPDGKPLIHYRTGPGPHTGVH